MHIEERKTYTMPFVKAILDEYSTETNDFFKRYNINVGSVLAIGFLEVNSNFKNIGNFEDTSILNLLIEFESFLQNFSDYEDISIFFSNQTDKLKKTFENSALYINKDIPDEVKWTIESEEKQINIALMQVKRAFSDCVVRLTSKERFFMLENWLSIFCSTYGLSFFGKGVMEEEKNVVYFERDNNISEWVIKIDADMQVISVSNKIGNHNLLEMVEYLLKNISNWDMLGISTIPPEISKYTIDKIENDFHSFHYFYSESE